MKKFSRETAIVFALVLLLHPSFATAVGDSTFVVENTGELGVTLPIPIKQAVISSPINLSSNEGISNSVLVDRDDSGRLHAIWNDNSVYPYTVNIVYARQESVSLSQWSFPYVITNTRTEHLLVDEDGSVNILSCSENEGLIYTKFDSEDKPVIPRMKLSTECGYKEQEAVLVNHSVYVYSALFVVCPRCVWYNNSTCCSTFLH